jgi:glycosyltransferase involved in cell wall biosynthesis
MPCLLSIIIPVFNVEQYLPQCVTSVLSQTFTNFELILVDDGSTDGSGRICDEFVAKDKRTQVVHIPNGGSSNARNTGLEMATGTYICFVDSDDWVDDTYLETLLGLFKKADVQLAVCGMTVEYPDHQEQWRCQPGTVTVGPEDEDAFLRLNQSFLLYGPCAKIYQHDILRQHGIRFDTSLSYGEDFVFSMTYLTHVSRIAVDGNPLYHYRKHNTTTLSTAYNERRFELDESFFEILYSFFETRGLLTSKGLHYLYNRYWGSICHGVFQINHPKCKMSLLGKYHHIKRILACNRFHQCFLHADTSDTPKIIVKFIQNRQIVFLLVFNALSNVKQKIAGRCPHG